VLYVFYMRSSNKYIYIFIWASHIKTHIKLEYKNVYVWEKKIFVDTLCTGKITFPLSNTPLNYLASEVLFYGTWRRVKARHSWPWTFSRIARALNIHHVVASLYREEFILRITSVPLKLVHWILSLRGTLTWKMVAL